MATTVKLCGLRRTEDVEALTHWQVDQVGFMFAPSKRQVTPEQAAGLIAAMRTASRGQERSPLAVGVFVNPDMEQLRQVMRLAPLDAVQLHGQESALFCAAVRHELRVSVIKAQPVAAAEEERDKVMQRLRPYEGAIDMLLLDTHDPLLGGTGKTFAWERIPPYREWATRAKVKLLVAGGLHPGNVGELIAKYGPDGVDVSSGVETDGVKDAVKMKRFVERVRLVG